MSPEVQAGSSTLELLGKPYNKSHTFCSNSRSISIKVRNKYQIIGIIIIGNYYHYWYQINTNIREKKR